MPYTLNGIGTTFYGQRDFRADGSYITTEWFAVLYLPIVPLHSLRVRYQGPGEQRWYLGFGSSESYAVYEKHFPNWKQVICTYGYIAFLAAWAYLVGSAVLSVFPHVFDTAWSVTLVFIACIIPVPTPWVLRYCSQRGMFHELFGDPLKQAKKAKVMKPTADVYIPPQEPPRIR